MIVNVSSFTFLIWQYVTARATPAVMRGTSSAMYIRRAAERLVVPSSQISPHSPPTGLSSSDLAMKASGITYINTLTLTFCDCYSDTM